MWLPAAVVPLGQIPARPKASRNLKTQYKSNLARESIQRRCSEWRKWLLNGNSGEVNGGQAADGAGVAGTKLIGLQWLSGY